MGLGNPGDRYAGTRHNVGFDVVDALARRVSGDARGSVRVDRLDCRALTGRVRMAGRAVMLAKPQTYMNLSGESVTGLVARHEVPLERLLVVADDAALPVGTLRLRRSGSSGGQKGLQSLIDCLKTNEFARLRIGIAGERFQPGEELADYVLSRFSKSERAAISRAVDTACDAIECWIGDGIDAAMNKFNRTPEVPA